MDSLQLRIKRTDEERRIIYAEAYPSNIVDTYGDFTDREELEKCAHKFLAEGLINNVDTMHNEVPNGSFVVESFFAKKNDPDYNEDSWVVGIKITDQETWDKVKSGKLSGLSISILTKADPVVAEIETDVIEFNETYPASDGHTHLFFMTYNEDGVVNAGRTSTDQGHSHTIRRGTSTEETKGHTHRIDSR